jgi:hypothetical protein
MINTMFIEPKYSRLLNLFLSSAYPKTQPLDYSQERSLPMLPNPTQLNPFFPNQNGVTDHLRCI